MKDRIKLKSSANKLKFATVIPPVSWRSTHTSASVRFPPIECLQQHVLNMACGDSMFTLHQIMPWLTIKTGYYCPLETPSG